jgi:hypothetical protein
LADKGTRGVCVETCALLETTVARIARRAPIVHEPRPQEKSGIVLVTALCQMGNFGWKTEGITCLFDWPKIKPKYRKGCFRK